MGRSCAVPGLRSAISPQLAFLEEEKRAGLFSCVLGSCPAQVLAVHLGKALGAAGVGRTGRAPGLSGVVRAMAAPLAVGRRLRAGECSHLATLRARPCPSDFFPSLPRLYHAPGAGTVPWLAELCPCLPCSQVSPGHMCSCPSPEGWWGSGSPLRSPEPVWLCQEEAWFPVSHWVRSGAVEVAQATVVIQP